MDTITIAPTAAQPLTVNRLGYGTMRLAGPGVWGEPADRAQALAVLRTAAEAGVQFFDTADYYGEDVTNRLIAEALHPYADDLVICTKVGATRKPDKSWVPFVAPDQLRTSIETNLRTLKLERMALVHFRVMPGNPTPFETSLQAMFDLQREGKILHVGVSNVTPEEVQQAMRLGPIATVENMYGHGQRTTMVVPHAGETRGGAEVLELCEQNGIPLIPFFSLANSKGAAAARVAAVAQRLGATPAQVNIAWLLKTSPWILPIPGTSSVDHLKENLAAADLTLSDDDMAELG